jgi:hypothetical protein
LEYPDFLQISLCRRDGLHPLIQGIDIESKNHRLCTAGQRGEDSRLTQTFTRSCQNQSDTGDRSAHSNRGFGIFIILGGGGLFINTTLLMDGPLFVPSFCCPSVVIAWSKAIAYQSIIPTPKIR